jgi:hypothetical protein
MCLDEAFYDWDEPWLIPCVTALFHGSIIYTIGCCLLGGELQSLEKSKWETCEKYA